MRKIVCGFFVLSVLFSVCGSCEQKSVESYASEIEEIAVNNSVYMEDDLMAEDLESVVTSNYSVSGGETFRFSAASNEAVSNYSAVKVKQLYKKEETRKLVGNTDESLLLKKKIIKDGNMSVQTDDIATSKEEIDNLVKSLDAYYERENLEKTNQKISYDLIIRVPASNFGELVSSVEQGKNEVKSKNIRARDVTEEYVDINIRLESKREYLKQYTALLAKATTIKDILEIKENIRLLHEEIERAEGRLRYLSDQVTFSTLRLDLFQKIDYAYKPDTKDSFIERMKSGLNTGWTIVVETVLFLINIWSVLLVLIPVVLFVVRKKRKKEETDKNSKDKTAEAKPLPNGSNN